MLRNEQEEGEVVGGEGRGDGENGADGRRKLKTSPVYYAGAFI
jgi:hypothetical protein